jgi:hypothetical protein
LRPTLRRPALRCEQRAERCKIPPRAFHWRPHCLRPPL